MRTKTFSVALGVLAALGTSPAVRAGECATNTFGLQSELLFPTYIGGAIGYDQPFATVTQTLLAFSSSQGCAGPCPTNPSIGDAVCGDLVTALLEVDELIAGLGEEDFARYIARLLPNGEWKFGAVAYLVAVPPPVVKTATINVLFGHREVFDVTSAESVPQPFRLRLQEREVVPAGPVSCPGIYRPIVGRQAQLHVNAQGSSQEPLPMAYLGGFLGDPPTRVVTLATNNPDYDRVIREWDFDLEVPANGVLFVDLIYANVGGSFASPVGDPPDPCTVTSLVPAWFDPGYGIQLFVSPGEALTAVARSGIVYEPVPEPGAFASGAIAVAALAARRRRSPGS